jgi:hypothetical protein
LYNCPPIIVLLENVFSSGLRHFLAALVKIQKEGSPIDKHIHVVGLGKGLSKPC